ncbi:MAG TPA: DUF5658 family protein [Bryobacteraceae bacterium]|nr:DUF5658 family protein [Bryobacteraceae bacterium]
MTIFEGDGMLYTEVFLYLQVLDLLTTLIGFKLGLAEASPFIRALLRFGPVAALILAKVMALVLAGACVTLHKPRLIRWVSYWFAGLIAWNLCTILTSGHCH